MKLEFASLAPVILVVGLAAPHEFLAQSRAEELTALQEEIKELKEGQAEVLRELEEIKALLRSLPQSKRAVPRDPLLSIDGDPSKGSPTAPVTVIEFSDYQCPYCARHAREVLPHLEVEYIKTGKVKYVFRDFPITAIHKDAYRAARAASCAGRQGKYWEMHDHLFANRNALQQQDLEAYASALGLQLPSFQECLTSEQTSREIREDMKQGRQAGVRGTPTFFIGLTDPGSPEIEARHVIRGAQPYGSFREAIESLLTAKQ